MAGISRSVTLTIAYLMAHFGLSMQDSYQFVKDKRPAISPNLNFMGQLVEFEKELTENPTGVSLDIKKYHPSEEQRDFSLKLMEKIMRTSSVSGLPVIESPSEKDHTDGGAAGVVLQPQAPFILKPISSKGRKSKKLGETQQKESENSSPNDFIDVVSCMNSLSISGAKEVLPGGGNAPTQGLEEQSNNKSSSSSSPTGLKSEEHS